MGLFCALLFSSNSPSGQCHRVVWQRATDTFQRSFVCRMKRNTLLESLFCHRAMPSFFNPTSRETETGKRTTVRLLDASLWFRFLAIRFPLPHHSIVSVDDDCRYSLSYCIVNCLTIASSGHAGRPFLASLLLSSSFLVCTRTPSYKQIIIYTP